MAEIKLRGSCCAEHGPDCENRNHPHIGLGLWRNGQGLCCNCGERPATIMRGIPTHIAFRSEWCERCDLEDALKQAYERRDAIPELERRLAALD